jgi:hypothetical protein
MWVVGTEPRSICRKPKPVFFLSVELSLLFFIVVCMSGCRFAHIKVDLTESARGPLIWGWSYRWL